VGSDTVNCSEAGGWRALAAAHYRQNQQQLSSDMGRAVPFCDDCRFSVNNGVAHCKNPRVSSAVRILTGQAPVAEMQLHFIRFTEAFCGIDGRWFEPKDITDAP
jgi:hypothetical protein